MRSWLNSMVLVVVLVATAMSVSAGVATAEAQDRWFGTCWIVGKPTADRHTICPKYDFTGANLSRFNLMHADLVGANFTGATMTQANLRHAKLANAKIIDADLIGADLSNAGIDGTEFTGTVQIVPPRETSVSVDYGKNQVYLDRVPRPTGVTGVNFIGCRVIEPGRISVVIPSFAYKQPITCLVDVNTKPDVFGFGLSWVTAIRRIAPAPSMSDGGIHLPKPATDEAVPQ